MAITKEGNYDLHVIFDKPGPQSTNTDSEHC